MLAIGIDAGGSKVAVGLIDTVTGAVLREASVPTPPRAEADARFLAQVAAAVQGLGAAPGTPVGLGICELVDLAGEVVSDHRIRWTRADMLKAFPDTTVVIEADARAAAIAEARLGAARGFGHWLYANAGTGVALVMMQGDRPHHGAHGRALATGVNPASLLPDQDGTTIEDLAGGAGMLARAAGLACGSTADLLRMADQGEPSARAIVAQGGAVFGGLLGFGVNTLDPEAIVLGGGLVLASAVYHASMTTAFVASVWHPSPPPQTLLRLCALGRQAGLIGAALCAVYRA